MSALGATGWIIAALALLWLGVATWLSLAASRRIRLAQSILGAARSHATLLEISPARPLLVHLDGRIEADPQLMREIGLKLTPARIGELATADGGLAAEDLEMLTQQIDDARASASRVTAKVRVEGSPRVFEVRGQPAPPPEPAGTMLLWFLDMSVAEEERAKLALRLRQTEGALNSLTHLIEAAPFPMWYRGPDLKLGLVNSAFVHAVEGVDAEDVIQRCAELIDTQD
jgi:PAS domain-containing protein